MRKQTKLVAVLSAAALLAIGASMTSFAATGWAEENGTWVYYDKDGYQVENEWKKSGNNWFWLNEDGEMATEALVEDGDDYYYVDANGVMVANRWVSIVNEEDEDDTPENYWYYFQSNGKAYKAPESGKVQLKTINGKKYAFDQDGRMLYGWVAADSAERITSDDGWNAAADMYYFGDENDGSMATNWQKLTVYDDGEEDDMDYWFYFKSNGKKFFNEKDDKDFDTKKINGKTYGFDNRGVMVKEWDAATNSNSPTAANYSYFGSADDGARMTKGWFKVVPSDEFDESNNDDENEKWYYANGDGTLEAGKLSKIKGKYYAFNEKGAMLSGLIRITVNSDDSINVLDDGVDADELDDLINDKTSGGDLYYFGDGEDGSMKLGVQTVTLDGDNYSFFFTKTGGIEEKGAGLTGKYNKVLYKYGKKIKADADDKYLVVKFDESANTIEVVSSKDLRADTRSYKNDKNETERATNYDFTGCVLVTTSGSIVKTKSNCKDGNDWYFDVEDGVITSYANNKNN